MPVWHVARFLKHTTTDVEILSNADLDLTKFLARSLVFYKVIIRKRMISIGIPIGSYIPVFQSAIIVTKRDP